MAHELAVEAILTERPDAVIVQGESIEYFHPAGRSAAKEADRLNGIKHLSLDLTLGRELGHGMAAYLNEHGVTSNDLSFFRERRAVGQRWLGTDYYLTCEHRVAANGRCTTMRNGMGFRALAAQYYQRYGLPLFYCETNQVSSRAVEWLNGQWSDVVALRSSGVPVCGFTWYSLTDQIDWQHALRVERNDLHPVGLYDLDRRPRPVARRYREIVASWSAAVTAAGAASSLAVAR
jgi:beta-glucosidase/6-phospho-beta-glucosidase/beta-galactosidase